MFALGRVYTYRILRYILWVPYYMHLLVMYFDYLLCDGSHGFSKYGWKFVPVCILTSGGWTVPIGSVFGLEEDKDSLNALIELFRQHCQKHGVECPHFNLRSEAGIVKFALCESVHFHTSVRGDARAIGPRGNSILDQDALAHVRVSCSMGTFHAHAHARQSIRWCSFGSCTTSSFF